MDKDKQIRELKNMVLLLYNSHSNKEVFKSHCTTFQREVLNKCDILIKVVNDTPFPVKPSLTL